MDLDKFSCYSDNASTSRLEIQDFRKFGTVYRKCITRFSAQPYGTKSLIDNLHKSHSIRSPNIWPKFDSRQRPLFSLRHILLISPGTPLLWAMLSTRRLHALRKKRRLPDETSLSVRLKSLFGLSFGLSWSTVTWVRLKGLLRHGCFPRARLPKVRRIGEPNVLGRWI